MADNTSTVPDIETSSFSKYVKHIVTKSPVSLRTAMQACIWTAPYAAGNVGLVFSVWRTSKLRISPEKATVRDGYKIISRMPVKILPACHYLWFKGESDVPIMWVFLCYFPPAHTYCISRSVAQQQRDNMSQHTWIWHKREQVVSGCRVVTVYPLRKKLSFHHYWVVCLQV